MGMHSTDVLQDGYLGSGKRLGYSRKKYGDQQHQKVILEMLPSRELLKLREKELVSDDLLKDPMCMNLQEGGGGGFAGEAHRKAFISSARTAKLRGTDQGRALGQKVADIRKLRGTDTLHENRLNWTGRKHKQETINKQSAAMKGRHDGENNPSFATCWVCKDQPMKIKKEHLDEHLTNGYRRGRK